MLNSILLMVLWLWKLKQGTDNFFFFFFIFTEFSQIPTSFCYFSVSSPFCRGFSQPRDQTEVSHIAGGFFTSWTTREAQEYWSGWSIPSPADLSDPGIKPGSPALQVHSLPTELPGKPTSNIRRFQGHNVFKQSFMNIYFQVHPCCYCLVAKSCLTLCDPMDCTYQALLSMGFLRQEHWSELQFPSPKNLPNLGIEPMLPAWQVHTLPLSHQGSPKHILSPSNKDGNSVSKAF